MADNAEALAFDIVELGQRVAIEKGVPPMCGPVMLFCTVLAVVRANAPRAADQLLDALRELPSDVTWAQDRACQDAVVAWAQETVKNTERTHG